MNDKSSQDILNSIKHCEPAFKELIRNRLGIKLHQYQTPDLHNTILNATKKFNIGPEEYLQQLTHCTFNSPLLEYLVSSITIGETYFFRDKNQMQLLYQFLLPKLIEEKKQQQKLSMRIWSAGCASGEEIYTIGMMLNELIPDLTKWNIQLLATDINTMALQNALKAQYREWSMRSITDYYKNKYFTVADGVYYLLPKIRNQVRLEYLNLNDNSYPSLFNGTNAQDLILCCNVLIYFDKECIKLLMKKLANCLVPGGSLLLGASDPIMLDATDLVFHQKQGTYFKKLAMEKISITKAPIKAEKKKIVHTLGIQKETSHVAITKLVQKQVNDKAVIIDLLNASRWQEVLTFIDGKTNQQSSFLCNAKAAALANLGKLDEALLACQEMLKADATNKYAYLICAQVLLELNKLDEAETILRKTLYIDHQFVEGHFQLGLLLLRNKKSEAGLKSLQNALVIAKKKDPAHRVSEFRDINFGQLADMLKHEIDLYMMTQG